jgi:hypothetical protein
VIQPLCQDNALCLSVWEVVVDERYGTHPLGGLMGRSAANRDDSWALCKHSVGISSYTHDPPVMQHRLPSSGAKRIADTVIYCGSAGGGVAIMLTLYPLFDTFAVGMHSLRCRGQSLEQSTRHPEEGRKRMAGLHTVWRCSGVQYHALWQRLHHIDVGRQQSVQGWLMRGIVDMREKGLGICC